MQNSCSKSLKPIDIILCDTNKLKKLCHEVGMNILKSSDIKKYNKMVAELEIYGSPRKFRRKLSVNQVRNIRYRRKQGETVKSIADSYMLTDSTVSSVCAWASYARIDPELKESYIDHYSERGQPRLYKDDIVNSIKQMVEKGLKRKEIANEMKLDPVVISRVMSLNGIKRIGKLGV